MSLHYQYYDDQLVGVIYTLNDSSVTCEDLDAVLQPVYGEPEDQDGLGIVRSFICRIRRGPLCHPLMSSHCFQAQDDVYVAVFNFVITLHVGFYNEAPIRYYSQIRYR